MAKHARRVSRPENVDKKMWDAIFAKEAKRKVHRERMARKKLRRQSHV